MLDFDRRAIIVYGISPSEDPPPLSRVEHDISKLKRCFSKILAENESANWILNYYLATGRNWHLWHQVFFFIEIIPFQAIKSPTKFREGNNPSIHDLGFPK